jgi:propionyl-CoA carboxylase alpha chain
LVRDEWVVIANGAHRLVKLTNGGGRFSVVFDSDARTVELTEVVWRPGLPTFSGKLDGVAFTVQVKPAAEGFVIRHRAAQSHVLVLTPRSAELHAKLPPKSTAASAKLVLSPMPGLVVTLDVVVGQEVKAGEAVAVIEAMKMQNIIRAERDGTIKSVGPKPGDSVAADEVLMEFV